MWHHITGTVHSTGPDHIVIETQGIGWMIRTPVATARAFRPGSTVRLWLHHHLSTDPNRGGEALYGFSETGERDLFRLLMTVKGVGPRQALVILSGCGPEAIVKAIQNGDAGILKKIKGVGPKTAQRLVLELKDAVGHLGGPPTDDSDTPSEPDTLEDTVMALVALGYKESDSRKAAQKARAEDSSDDVAHLVRQALLYI